MILSRKLVTQNYAISALFQISIVCCRHCLVQYIVTPRMSMHIEWWKDSTVTKVSISLCGCVTVLFGLGSFVFSLKSSLNTVTDNKILGSLF